MADADIHLVHSPASNVGIARQACAFRRSFPDKTGQAGSGLPAGGSRRMRASRSAADSRAPCCPAPRVRSLRSRACRSEMPPCWRRVLAFRPCRRRQCGRMRHCRPCRASDAKCAAKCGNILVAPLGDLVDLQTCPLRGRAGISTASTNSPGRRSCLPYSMKIVFQRDAALAGRRAQMQAGPERNQGGWHVANRRTIGDVAADGSHIAHLLAADALDKAPSAGC